MWAWTMESVARTGPGFLKQANAGANMTVASLQTSDLPAPHDVSAIRTGTLDHMPTPGPGYPPARERENAGRDESLLKAGTLGATGG